MRHSAASSIMAASEKKSVFFAVAAAGLRGRPTNVTP